MGGFTFTDQEYQKVMDGLGYFATLHDRVFLISDPFCSLVVPALVASLWGEATNGFFVAGALRWMFVQHVTFFVNSVAHGECHSADPRAFDFNAKGIGPRVSFLTTVLALGEGWHDYHHLFPWDYAAAELDAWDQWNPTKVFIDAFALRGLAYDRRRCSQTLQETYRLRLMGDAAQGGMRFNILGRLFLRYKVPEILSPHTRPRD